MVKRARLHNAIREAADVASEIGDSPGHGDMPETPDSQRARPGVAVDGGNTAPVVVITGTIYGPVIVGAGPSSVLELDQKIEVPAGLPTYLEI